MVTRSTISLSCAFTLILLHPLVRAQEKQKRQHSDNPGIVRKDDPSAPCEFAPEFQRISDDKSDPRVAYIEIEPRVNHPGTPTSFGQLCRNVAAQSEDIEAAVFDKAHGFLHIIYGVEVVNTAVAYFAGEKGSPGIILYVDRSDGEFRSFVFTYQKDEWHDRTKEYLGPLHLAKNDYILVPQYGRTARVMTIAEHGDSGFQHKGWLRWTGVKFELETKRPKGWRCPDSCRYFEADERRKFCE